MSEGHRTLRARLRALYARHRRTFWMVHSLWALATGVVVVVLAHERYEYAGWVLACLVLTWLSTLYFSRLAPPADDGSRRLRHEVASYLTRVMYQETLFFLLPFYFQSTVPRSPNVAFLGLLGLLALVSCLDLVFDDLLRRRRWFGLLFFSIVSFAALDFLLPLVLGLRLELATQLAAAAGLLAAITLVERPRERRRWREVAVQALPTLGATGLLLGFPVLVPAVPLQLEEIAFARGVLPDTLELVEPLGEAARSGDDRLAVVATIFAPRRVHAGVELEWRRDKETLEVSREIEVAPHRGGFRVWDTYRPAGGRLPPGTYTVIVRTTPGQVVGIGRVRLSE